MLMLTFLSAPKDLHPCLLLFSPLPFTSGLNKLVRKEGVEIVVQYQEEEEEEGEKGANSQLDQKTYYHCVMPVF